MTFRKALLIFGVLQLLACGPSSQQNWNIKTDNANDVIDGEVIIKRTTKASRSVVAVQLVNVKGEEVGYCTGALIDAQTVLTAAHCFNQKKVPGVAAFNIIFETRTKFLGKPLLRKGISYIQHPQYDTELKDWLHHDGKFIDQKLHPDVQMSGKDYISSVTQGDHDLAVAVFEGSLPSGFEPAAIDMEFNVNYINQPTSFYGYGRAVDYLDPKGLYDTSTGQLRKGSAVVDQDFNDSPDRYFTKKSSKNSVCQGDSGGPHFFTDKKGVTKIIGVTSSVEFEENSIPVDKKFGEGLFSCRARAQVAKVGPFSDWIKREEKRLLSEMKAGQ